MLAIHQPNFVLYHSYKDCMHLDYMYRYGVAQFKLHTSVSRHMCLHIYHMQNLKILRAHALLHVILGVSTSATIHTQYTSDACHELALGLPHYTCGVQVQ